MVVTGEPRRANRPVAKGRVPAPPREIGGVDAATRMGVVAKREMPPMQRPELRVMPVAAEKAATRMAMPVGTLVATEIAETGAAVAART